MEKLEQLYEGKAKKVFRTDDDQLYIVSYKDDATALNGLKKGSIENKGIVNNLLTNYLMRHLEEKGVPTHFVRQLSDRETLVKKVTIVPLEVIVRNIAAGSLSKRLGIAEGTQLASPVLEFCYKNDELGDPMVNDYHIYAMNICSAEELRQISSMAFKVNDFLKEYFSGLGITLVDFKIEFGKTDDGKIILADEISPDTCRLWDSKTGEHLDKDRFRRDLPDTAGGYREVIKRALGKEI